MPKDNERTWLDEYDDFHNQIMDSLNKLQKDLDKNPNYNYEYDKRMLQQQIQTLTESLEEFGSLITDFKVGKLETENITDKYISESKKALKDKCSEIKFRYDELSKDSQKVKNPSIAKIIKHHIENIKKFFDNLAKELRKDDAINPQSKKKITSHFELMRNKISKTEKSNKSESTHKTKKKPD